MPTLSLPFSLGKNKDTGSDVIRLIDKQKWKKLYKILTTDTQSKKTTCGTMCNSDVCTADHSLLHLACQNQPPLNIVEELATACSDSVYQVNCMNRYPLHVALEFGASSSVIEYLIGLNRQAVTARDIQGKTPLHLLFHNYLEKKRLYDAFGVSHEMNRVTFEIVRMLCDVAPMLAIVEDFEEKTPLEYAIEGEADWKVIRMLQKVSGKARKCKIIDSNTPNVRNEDGQPLTKEALDFMIQPPPTPLLSTRARIPRRRSSAKSA